jgi:hypothetical protein
MFKFIIQIGIYEFILIYDRQTQQKNLSSKKWAFPLSPGTQECVCLVQKKNETLTHAI